MKIRFGINPKIALQTFENQNYDTSLAISNYGKNNPTYHLVADLT